jgi:hypothetical protein
MTSAPVFDHPQSHRTLLRRVVPVPSLVDVVVVPATRPVEHLAPAAELARGLGSMLVVLCSRGLTARAAAGRLAEFPDLRWVAVDIPSGYRPPGLDLGSSRATEAKAGRLGDLSTKRNVGLLLARHAGWERLLFLDDDIPQVDELAVWRGAAALGSEALVGMHVDQFPDHSVVCHANLRSGGPQETFVSGSALLVDCRTPPSFFPEIYNEDWLFMYPALIDRRVAASGQAVQLDYDPFDDVARAVDEEFGEVIAEGLNSLLTRGRPVLDAFDADYWRLFLDVRGRFVRGIADRVEALDAPDLARAVLPSLRAADERRSELTAETCAAYIRTWNRDVVTWTDGWSRRVVHVRLDRSLRALGLLQHSISTEF